MPPRFPAVRGLLLVLALSLFTSAPAQLPIDPPRGDFRFVVFGDFNGSYGALEYPPAVARATQAIARRWQPDLLLSPGDVVAGQSRALPDERFRAMWETFDREIATPLREAGIPYAVAMGNHDASSLQNLAGEYVFARGRVAAIDYWSQPMYESNLVYVDRRRFPFDYAFRSGPAFVVMLDASSATISPEQQDWLEWVLKLPTAGNAEMRLVVGHLPLAPVAEGRDSVGEVIAEPLALRRILEEGGVDLYVSGHHAAYYPGRLGELELLFAGGVGGRRLLGEEGPARSTVTLVDVRWDPLDFRYTTFDLATMQVVAPGTLPPAIGSGDDAVRISERAYPPAVETAQR